jgi:hypothetical protein
MRAGTERARVAEPRAGRALRRIGLVALAASIAPPATAQYTIDWLTIDGGGAMQSTGGTYTLGGTIGQPDAGLLSGGSYELGGGFWQGGGTVVGIPGEDAILAGAIPGVFRIHPAAPNPLVHQTSIAFDLPHARHVSARVYDVAGRLTRTLADELLQAGRHERIWDGANDSGHRVTAGIYFVVLDAGKDRARQKVLVLR